MTLTKEQIKEAVQAHAEIDKTTHEGLLDAVIAYNEENGSTPAREKLQKELEKHVEKTDDGHDELLALVDGI